MGYPPQGARSSQSGTLVLASDIVPYAEITTTETTVPLPSIAVDGLPVGAIIDRVVAILKYSVLRDLGGGSSLDGDQYIQARNQDGGSWIDAILLPASCLWVDASQVLGGDAKIGHYDIKAQLPPNGGTLEFQWTDALSDNDEEIEDVQMVIHIMYHRS